MSQFSSSWNPAFITTTTSTSGTMSSAANSSEIAMSSTADSAPSSALYSFSVPSSPILTRSQKSGRTAPVTPQRLPHCHHQHSLSNFKPQSYHRSPSTPLTPYTPLSLHSFSSSNSNGSSTLTTPNSIKRLSMLSPEVIKTTNAIPNKDKSLADIAENWRSHASENGIKVLSSASACEDSHYGDDEGTVMYAHFLTPTLLTSSSMHICTLASDRTLSDAANDSGFITTEEGQLDSFVPFIATKFYSSSSPPASIVLNPPLHHNPPLCPIPGNLPEHSCVSLPSRTTSSSQQIALGAQLVEAREQGGSTGYPGGKEDFSEASCGWQVFFSFTGKGPQRRPSLNIGSEGGKQAKFTFTCTAAANFKFFLTSTPCPATPPPPVSTNTKTSRTSSRSMGMVFVMGMLVGEGVILLRSECIYRLGERSSLLFFSIPFPFYSIPRKLTPKSTSLPRNDYGK